MASGSQNMTTYNAKRIIGDKTAKDWAGSLLHSGTGGKPGTGDGSDTWIFADDYGTAAAPWGIKHDQTNNDILFIGGGTTNVNIHLGSSKVTATTFEGNASTATRINGNLSAATSNADRNIWVSSTTSADGIPNYISGFNMNPSTKVFTVPSGTRISPSAGALYLGNSGNQNWVYVQDMASQASGTPWKLTQAGVLTCVTVNANLTGYARFLQIRSRLNADANAMNFNPNADGVFHISAHIMDSTSRSKSAANSPSFDATVLNFPWDWGGYNGQIAMGSTGTARLQIRSASHTDKGEGASPRYVPSYTDWREVVTATKATQIGSSTNGVYISNTGQATAMTYSLSATVNAASVKNTLAYYSGTNAISSYPRIRNIGSARYPIDIYLYNDAGNAVAELWYDSGDATNFTLGRWNFLAYSPKSTANTATTGKYEYFYLPDPTKDRTSNASYAIRTSKDNNYTVSNATTAASCSGNAATVSRATFGDSSNGEHNANNITSNGLYYYTSNGPSAQLGARSTDGSIYCQAYNTSWVSQIAQDYRDGGLYVRGKNNGSWQKWLQVMLVDLTSSAVTNCNSVYRTGIYTHGGFSNRPAGVGNWGTLANYKLYESNNNYHRQIFYDCYGTDRVWTRSCDGGTWTGWKQFVISGTANNLDEGTSDWTDNTEILTSYASNNGFADGNAKGTVYRRDAVCAYNYIKSKASGVWAIYATDCGDGSSMWIHPQSSDEVNFGGTGGKNIYFGHRDIGSRAKPTDYYFGGTAASASVRCTNIYATRWRTPSLELAELNADRMGLCNHGQGTAKGLNVGSLLISSAWADASKVPTNGMYCKGDARFDTTIIFNTSHAYHWVMGGGSSYTWMDVRNTSNSVLQNILGYSDRIYISRLQVASESDVTPNSNSGGLIIGSMSGSSIGIDSNEIMARSSNAVSTIYINSEGGDLYFGTSCAIRFTGGHIYATAVHNAVWNDFAEYRQVSINEPGRVVIPDKDGYAKPSTARLQAGARVISDTFGCTVGKSDTAKTPLGMAGRVLAYPYRAHNEYHIGDCVCSAPNGTVDIMTREEIMMYPDRIIGIVNEIPTYSEWHQTLTHYDETRKKNNVYDQTVQVKGRIWIDIK